MDGQIRMAMSIFMMSPGIKGITQVPRAARTLDSMIRTEPGSTESVQLRRCQEHGEKLEDPAFKTADDHSGNDCHRDKPMM